MLNSQALRAALEAVGKRLYGLESEKPGPWALTSDGREWAIATDAHLMLAVPREAVDGECLPCPQRIVNLAAKGISFRAAAPSVLAIDKLRAFTGLSDVKPDCTKCHGKGTVRCDECGGDGEVDCECACGNAHRAGCESCVDGIATCRACKRKDRPGKLLSNVLNVNLLADILHAAASGDPRDVEVSIEDVGTRGDYPAYLLRPHGDGPPWMALLMPMSEHVPPQCEFTA